MIDFMRLLVNLYATASLFALFVWYVVEDLSGLLPVTVSALILMDFMCGGFLIQRCWQEAKAPDPEP